ncbi:MAG: extensin family protein [Pseudomonadota bacterium]
MRRIALLGLIVPLVLGEAQAAGKLKPPLPKPKPDIGEMSSPPAQPSEPESAEPGEPAPQTAGTKTAPVIPREKPPRDQPSATENPFVPQGGGKPDEATKPKEEAKPQETAKPKEETKPEDEVKPEPGEEMAACREELAALGAKFTVPEMPAAEGQCKVVNPVRIDAIATPAGTVDFPGAPTLNCIFAKQFTSWVADIAAPVVKAHTGDALAAISTGPGYECRNRNGDSTTKISEHAFGNAVDIASFNLPGKKNLPVSNVVKLQNAESRWLMALRISACGYFTTVLGPGSNAAHAEHYHFDLGLHGKTGNYRICE